MRPSHRTVGLLLGLALGVVLPAGAPAQNRAKIMRLKKEIRQLETQLKAKRRELAAERRKTRPPSSSLGDEPMLGEIRHFAGTFAPRGWALCNGQLLAINQYSALFSLLGTTYGGDGRTTFALPDLRGRTPVHAGAGPGIHERGQGVKGGGRSAPSNPGGTRTLPTLALNTIIALEGVFPSRN